MNEVEIVKQCLKTIQKKGDLYDVISLKEDVKPRKRKLLKANILFFSRILYAGVLVLEKIESFFAPIRKVKKAQDQIREILEIPIDIVLSKDHWNDFNNMNILSKPYLSVLYENSSIEIAEYVEHLKKILDFCELYNIDKILLRMSDILESFPNIDLEEFQTQSKRVLLSNEQLDKSLNCQLLVLNQEELLQLIKKLEVVNIDKRFVTSLKEKIEDSVVRKAISEFQFDDDIEKLKTIINSRLALLINSDSAYKDRFAGKVFESVTINGECIQIITTDSEGKFVDNTTMTLYDYLEVLDYQNLLEQIKGQNDNKEIFLIATVYLYLCRNQKERRNQACQSVSFYDQIFQNFEKKKQGKIKKIPEICNKEQRRDKNFANFIVSFYLTAIIFSIYLITGTSLDFIQQFAFSNTESNITKSMVDTLLEPYAYSFHIEFQAMKKIITTIGKAELDLFGLTSDLSSSKEGLGKAELGSLGLTGDSSSPQEEREIAKVISFQNGSIPSYFASGYATGATYNNGQMEFSVVQPNLSADQFQIVNPLFEIEIEISKGELKQAISNNQIHLSQTLYPIGDHYVITSLCIIDESDSSKFLLFDSNRVWNWNFFITEEEKELLNSIKRPMICYRYGVCNYMQNIFVKELGKENSYTDLPSSEIWEAITHGLHLDNNATIEEIYQAIQSKQYSTTPIQDAGLTSKIKKMEEKEYFETIASLDSLICNLAATLAVGANEELIYTVGYMNDGDSSITNKEMHAWAMTTDGEIIDVTPASEEKETDKNIIQVIENILSWGMKAHVPFYIIAVIAAAVVNKLFGKQIQLHIKAQKIKKMLDDPNVEEAYAKLKDVIYGQTNVPVNRNWNELMDAIDLELRGFSIEELQKIKQELCLSDFGENHDLLKQATNLINEVSFLRENSEQLKKVMVKKKN